jgi:hypothetical protein
LSSGHIILLLYRYRQHATLLYTACASEVQSSPSPTLRTMYLDKLLLDENVFNFPQKTRM